jgi:hypothetical protein
MNARWIETDHLTVPTGAIASLQQHPIYAAAWAALGCGVRCYRLTGAEGRCLAEALILVRRWPLLGATAILARGPLWAAALPQRMRTSALCGLLAFLRAQFHCVVATPDPEDDGADPLECSGWLATMTRCTLARIDLRPEVPALRAAMLGKWRNRLVRAEAAGLSLHHAPFSPRRDVWLLDREVAQARTRGYRQFPPAFVEAWCRSGGATASRLFTASHGGKPVAAMLFLLHGAGASYQIGWSGPEGRASGAHNLLLWQAMLHLRSRGVRMLDLDVIDTQTAPGLARFKLGSGARPLRLGATRLSAPGTPLFARSARHRVGVRACSEGIQPPP